MRSRVLRCFLLTLLGLTALPGTAAPAGTAGPWMPPLNLSGTAGNSAYPVVRLGPAHDLLVVWSEYETDPGGEVVLRRRVGGDWGPTENLSNSPYRDEGAALWADAGGVDLAWTRRSTGYGSDIVYRHRDGADWSAEVVLDHTAVYVPSPYGLQFVRDAQGRLCLFVTLGSGIAHTCRDETGWAALSSWHYVPGARAIGMLALGPDGLFHAALLGTNVGGYTGCDVWLSDAYYATTDGETWSSPVNLVGVGSIAYDMALAFDAEGRLHFLWSDISPFCSYDSERSAVYERILEGGHWTDRAEVSVPNEGQAVEDLALEVDGQGWLHLAWSEGLFDQSGAATGLQVHYRLGNGLVWGGEEVVGEPAYALRVDMATGLNGAVMVVWQEGPVLEAEAYFAERRPWLFFLPLLFR